MLPGGIREHAGAHQPAVDAVRDDGTNRVGTVVDADGIRPVHGEIANVNVAISSIQRQIGRVGAWPTLLVRTVSRPCPREVPATSPVSTRSATARRGPGSPSGGPSGTKRR